LSPTTKLCSRHQHTHDSIALILPPNPLADLFLFKRKKTNNKTVFFLTPATADDVDGAFLGVLFKSAKTEQNQLFLRVPFVFYIPGYQASLSTVRSDKRKS
jgi:hypothetical protein